MNSFEVEDDGLPVVPSATSPALRNQWRAAYQLQKEELPDFPKAEASFEGYLEVLRITLKVNSSRYPDHSIAARLSELLAADAKLSEAIPFYEVAVVCQVFDCIFSL
jgi:hypothetical protein